MIFKNSELIESTGKYQISRYAKQGITYVKIALLDKKIYLRIPQNNNINIIIRLHNLCNKQNSNGKNANKSN